MKKILLLVSVFVFTLNFAKADVAIPEAPVSVKIELYAARELILIAIKNNSRTLQTVMFTPGNSMNLLNTIAFRERVAAGEEKSIELKIGSVEGIKLPLVLDYKVAYVREETKGRAELFTPVKFYIKNRAGDFIESDSSALQLAQVPAIDRNVRVEPSTIDLGAGIQVETTLGNRAFVVHNGTPEEENSPIVPVRAELPSVLADRIPLNSLPTNIEIPTGPILPAPRRAEINVLEKNFAEKGKECDPLGLFTCFMGQLRFTNPKTINIPTPAAWGYRVELWASKTIFGATVNYLAASTETDGTGEWVIRMAKKDAPDFSKVIFKPINRFIQVVHPSTMKPYQYQDFVQREVYKKSLYKGASEESVAIIYNLASKLWVRLTNGKINPLYGFGPYTIAYPNAMTINGQPTPCTYKDAEGMKHPWSCALSAPNGAIYLIPGHDNADTVVHELGHKIHRQFWGKFPQGSGGSHSLYGCYNKALAIVEGFANFLAVWAKSTSKDDTAAWFHGENVETFRNGACFKAENELAVTGMLWDLYDTQQETQYGDGMSDQTSFYSDTNSIGHFLGNGVQPGAPDYLNALLKNHAGDPQILRGLFLLNNVLF